MWNDTEIVSLDEAKDHKRITGTAEDADLELKLAQAHALVLDYVYKTRPADAERLATMQAWDDETAPKAIQAAILEQFAELVQFRGDDLDLRAVDGTNLAPRVRRCLLMYTDPVIA